ncbi:6-bladed beta-propeller [Pollutibacter soli]|uniref:6-bladed beta-propeller n=1 Tax=Pollutibacter soli TaxID=3034157 RepID=UPI003013FB80
MEQIIGHNSHRYTIDKNWGIQHPAKYPVNDCHEMVMDSKGRLFMLTNDTRNNILIYDKSGKITASWGTTYPGAHGLSICNENGTEFLFITDTDRQQVFKTTLDGEEVMVMSVPKEIKEYTSGEQFKPTETAVAPDGDIYVTDGYGLQFVIQYNSKGEYIRHWGGLGNGDEQFDCVHGIAIDNRNPDAVSLIITSRNHNALKHFTLDGKYLSTTKLPGSFICRPVVHGENIYGAVFRSEMNTLNNSGYITILDKNNKVISTPGGTEPVYTNGVLQLQKKADHTFLHPHDVCVDDEENIYVPQWNSGKTYPVKLTRIK